MLLSSGLLSLNIHDALTFDGTELVIHPDLFDGGCASASTTRHSILTKSPLVTSVSGSAATMIASTPLRHERHLSEGSFSTNDHHYCEWKAPDPPHFAGGSNTSKTKLLNPGDLVEIRVWDPIPQVAGNQRSSLVLTRGISSDPVPTQLVSPVTGTRGLSKVPLTTTKATLEAAALALKDPKSKGSSAAVSQHSVDAHTPSPATLTPEALRSPRLEADRKRVLSEDGCDSCTASTIEQGKTTPLEESPKGSRSRVVDPLRPQGRPPLIQRSRTPTTAAAIAVQGKVANLAHFRNISDVTMDTLVGANYPSIETGPTATDLALQSIDSHDLDQENIISKIALTHTLRLSIIMPVAEKTLTSLKGKARSQISVMRQVADLYNLSPYDMVTVNRVDNKPEMVQAVSADFVAVTIKDQFISRGDMHYFQKWLIGRWIYEGERLGDNSRGIKAHAREIRHADDLAKSGIVTEDTVITFRSRSTRIIWLVQMSSEMWDYACPYDLEDDRKEESVCELVFDKFVRFIYKLFHKWKELEVTHSLTVVFFSRTFKTHQDAQDPMVGQDVYGRHYEDHYKTVVDNETHSDWDSLVVRIKRAFVKYPFEIGWDLTHNGGRRPSTAMQGNLLEAINVTLNLLQFHYLDRDLHRTGNSIVVVSPECGVFEVDKALAGITYQRMMDNGIGSDMVCLGLPPLHVAPFFLYNNVYKETENDRKEGEHTFSEVPHWMHLSFVSYDGEALQLPKREMKQNSAIPGDENLPISVSVASNGFLITEVTPRPGGIVEATPFDFLPSNPLSARITKSQSQQRQLISGRDFKDILKACRPRTSSYVLPSPLANLLTYGARETAKDNSRDQVENGINQALSDVNEGRLRLKEWGTVDFDDADCPMSHPGSNAPARARRISSPVPGAEPPSESSDKSTPSSSFASQISNMLGRSLERGTPTYSFLSGSQAPSPSLAIRGMQIQRSPSLEFEVDRNAELRLDELDADNLQKLMGDHDELYSRDPSKFVRTKPEVSGPISSIREVVELEGADDLGTSFGSEASGGLGAALMRYNASGNHLQGSRDQLTTKRVYGGGRPPIITGSPTNHGGLAPDVTTRAAPFLTSGVSRVGSEPPEFPQIQVKHSFIRNQQQFRSVQETGAAGFTGSLAGSLDHRWSSGRPFAALSTSLSAANGEGRYLAKSPPSMVKGSPNGNAHVAAALKSGGSSKSQHPLASCRNRNRGSRHANSNKKSVHVVNPFRQQDEDDELAKKSHNRRRWSHVFPLGELEFKRHAGPLWKSLCQPAILPLTIDYFPSPQELEDEEAFRFNPYQLTLQGMEHTHYASHRELLMEMVRQRITQDFQVVPSSVLSASNAASEGDIQHTLSMGHRIHVLTYDSQSDTIRVKLYSAITGDDKPITYSYFMYSPATKSYRRLVQTFEKYSKPYRWNTMDHVILEDIDTGLSEAMRCRRLQFGLIPPNLVDDAIEKEYVEKFKRLLDYLGKLRAKDDAQNELPVKIVTTTDEQNTTNKPLTNLRRGTTDEMRKFRIQLRKKETELYEWAEVAIDSTFDTSRSYRIIFNWLVASTSKVETQVNLLQRRSVQYGLELISFPQSCISRDLFLNPLVVPEIFCARKPGSVPEITRMLLEADFVADGIHMTDPSYLLSIDDVGDFKFPPKRRSSGNRSVAARQYVHRSGSMFARLILDEQKRTVLAVLLNHRIIRERVSLQRVVESVVARIQCFMDTLESNSDSG